MVTTAIAGAIIGIAGARLRGPYLAGATLSLAVALPQVPTHFASIFGGNQGISVVTPGPPDFLGGSFSAFEWFDWVCLAAALITFFLLANVIRGATGRRLRMVRDNEVAARLAGVNVARTQVLAYVISAVCAGLAGSLFAYWATITSPTGFTLNLSLALLTAIVVGGLGSLTGAVIGSFILVYLPVWTGGFASNLNLASNVANNVPARHLRDRAHRRDPPVPAWHRRGACRAGTPSLAPAALPPADEYPARSAGGAHLMTPATTASGHRRSTRMRLQIRRSRTWAVATAGMTAAVLTAACGSSSSGPAANSASAPGITATTVTIGSTQPLTGPAALGLLGDRAGVQRVLQVRERARRCQRSDDHLQVPGRHVQPDDHDDA